MEIFQSYIDFDNDVIVESKYAECYINGYCQRITITDVKDRLTPKKTSWFSKLLKWLKLK